MYSLRKQYNLARKQLKSNFYSSLPDKVNDSYNNTKQFGEISTLVKVNSLKVLPLLAWRIG